jgi:hypothetical protein
VWIETHFRSPSCKAEVVGRRCGQQIRVASEVVAEAKNDSGQDVAENAEGPEPAILPFRAGVTQKVTQNADSEPSSRNSGRCMARLNAAMVTRVWIP